ncbi:hypothetical protein EHP00_707 [Ecytonucleospora hepatopenaei]|uniref:Uncharacterized protein n=1 Tax=Ecytonucleospora hepatopenaei TaxID=646526 RepID=A0A1W0E3R0_9MICR|nr:hypothetical protein EHP00_707 [Ecytonucleospora hepatopenaei]
MSTSLNEEQNSTNKINEMLKEETRKEEKQVKLYIEQLCESKFLIFRNGRIKTTALEHLNIIFELLTEHFTVIEEYKMEKQKHMPRLLESLCNVHNKDDFYDILLCCMNCPQTYKVSYKILLIILECKAFVPEKMRSKKFAFWCSEKILVEIYSILLKKPHDDAINFLKDSDIYEHVYNEKYSEIQIDETNTIRYLLKIVYFILKYDPNFVFILHSTGFFKLINALNIKEVAVLYNEIFNHMDFNNEYLEVSCEDNLKIDYTSDFYKNFEKDAVFVIQRPHFPVDEVILRNLTMFKFKKEGEKRSDTKIHREVYNELTNSIFRELVECFVNDFYNVLAYKPISYISEEIEVFLNSVYAEFGKKKQANIVKKIKTAKYKIILEALLLYHKKQLKLTGATSAVFLKNILGNIDLNDKIRNLSVYICTYYIDDISYVFDITNKLPIKHVFLALEYEGKIEEVLRLFDLLRCLFLPESINSYKPSYLIILRSILLKFNELIFKGHPLSDKLDKECEWIQEYFKHFIHFLTQNKLNVAEIILSKKAFVSKRSGKITYNLDEGNDFYGFNAEKDQQEEYKVISPENTQENDLKHPEIKENTAKDVKYNRFVEDSE